MHNCEILAVFLLIAKHVNYVIYLFNYFIISMLYISIGDYSIDYVNFYEIVYIDLYDDVS